MNLPFNDSSIADEDALLRRVPNRPKLVADDGQGGKRPSSAALELRENDDGCSVDVQCRLADPGAPESALAGCPADWGLASFAAGAARVEDRHRVVGNPLEDNEAHALVVPVATTRAAQKRNFSMLARQMTWVRQPGRDDGVS